MAFGLMDKLTNFLMPVEEEYFPSDIPNIKERRTQLKVHTPSTLKVYIMAPQAFDDVKIGADCLKARIALLINYELVDSATQQRIADFLNGVAFIVGSDSQKISETVMLYVPHNVEINKELYAYSGMKHRKDI